MQTAGQALVVESGTFQWPWSSPFGIAIITGGAGGGGDGYATGGTGAKGSDGSVRFIPMHIQQRAA